MLTKEELLLVADVADRWPAGIGKDCYAKPGCPLQDFHAIRSNKEVAKEYG